MRQLGPYRLEQELGRGGMGAVYRAVDTRSGDPVALKVLLQIDPELLERFRREVESVRDLVHPNLVRVLGLSLAPPRPYAVFELVGGETLAQRVARAGPLPWRAACEVAREVAAGLSAVHQRGLVHRDVKPENVILGAAGAKLADFGLVKDLDEKSLTESGATLGTPSYLAPEQVGQTRGSLGEATDVYGLAATLYYSLTGQPPFGGATVVATLAQVVSAPPPSVRERAPDVPRWLDAVVARGLAKDRRERYANSIALRAALRPEAAAREPRPWKRVGLGLAGVALAATGVWAVRGAPPRSPSAAAPGRGEPKAAIGAASEPLAGGAATAGERAASDEEVERALRALEVVGAALREGGSLLAGAKALEPEELGRADEELTGLLERYPRSRRLYWARGLVRAQLGRLVEALLDVDEALALGSEDAGILLVRVDLLRRLGREEEALQEAGRARELDPERAEQARTVYVRFGQGSLAEGRYREGLSTARLADALGGGRDVDELRARALDGLERYAEVVTSLAAADEAGELSPHGHYLLGRALAALGRNEGAERALRAAVEADPRPAHLLQLAQVLYRSAPVEAKEFLGRVPAGAPEEPLALLLHATLLAQAGRVPAARADVVRALEIPGGLDAEARAHAEALLARLSAGSRSGPSDPDLGTQVARATQLREQGQLDQADAHLTRLLEEFPGNDEDLLLRRAVVRQLWGRGEAARDDVERALAQAPEAWAVWAKYAAFLVAAGEFGVALDPLERALAGAPATLSPSLHQARGEVLGNTGRFAEALDAFDRALALGLASPHVHGSRAKCLARLDREDEALAALGLALEGRLDRETLGVLQRLHEQDPRDRRAKKLYVRALVRVGDAEEARRELALLGEGADPERLLVQGEVLALEGRPEEALEAFGRALDVDPARGAVWRARARVLAELGRAEEALRSVEGALEHDPADLSARVLRAKVLGGAGRSEEVLEELARPPAVAGAEGELLRAEAYLDLGRHAQALAAVDRGLWMDARVKVGRWLRARALLGLGRKAEGRGELLAHLEAHGEHVQALLLLARVELNGRRDVAREVLDRALGLRPTHEGYGLRAELELLERKHAEAIADLGRALASVGDDPARSRYLVLRAQALIKLRQAPAALADCEAALEAGVDGPELRLWRGMALAEGGELERALGDLDRALEWRPDSVRARLSKAQVLARAKRVAEALQEVDRVLTTPDLPASMRELARGLREQLVADGE